MRLRLLGGRQFSSDADRAAASMGRVGRAGQEAAAGTSSLRDRLGGTFGIVRKAAGIAGFAGLGYSMFNAVKGGLSFNAQLEASQARFALFTDSAAEAGKVVEDVNRIAMNSTFART